MNEILKQYKPKKIKLFFLNHDVRVTESDNSVRLNQYANALFLNFTIDSPDFNDKKGVFVFTVDGNIVYVGMTNDSLFNVIHGTYGNITPRKLRTDGQITACRLSGFLNANFDRNIELWFIANEDKDLNKKIKRELIAAYNPVINNNIRKLYAKD